MPAPLNSFSSSMLSCLPRFCHTFSVLLLQYPMCINRNVFVYKETEHANYCALRGNSTTMSENMQGCSMAHFPARGVFESVTGLEQVYTYLIWPRLFKRWIALSTGQITIQRISIRETDCIIHWIDFYPVDSAVQRLDNRGQKLECLWPFYIKDVNSKLLSRHDQQAAATTTTTLFFYCRQLKEDPRSIIILKIQ